MAWVLLVAQLQCLYGVCSAQKGKCLTNPPWEEYEEGLEDVVATDFAQIAAQLRVGDDSSQEVGDSLAVYILASLAS